MQWDFRAECKEELLKKKSLATTESYSEKILQLQDLSHQMLRI